MRPDLRPLRNLSCALCLLASAPLAALAQSGEAGSLPERFQIEGSVLVYDTENVPQGVSASISNEDVDVLHAILQDNSGISTLRLNSDGGSTWASRQLADIVVDFGLDTEVDGVCASSCARVFLAGKSRSMTRGSRIGFHQFWWSATAIREYYERDAAAEGWNDPFEFTSWVYQDTQFEIHEQLLFMVRRGVDPVFAIETLNTRPQDVWYPYRPRLLAAGVLTR